MQKKSFLLLFIFTIIATIITFGQPTDASASSGFQVQNGVLKDSNGNSFVIRGINNPHIWYDKKAYNALDEIAKTGANSVRIVWDTTGKASRLEEIIKRCVELNMIAMPELHCATGKDCTEEIKDRARYWAREDVSAVLKKYQEYVIVNIANETGYSSCCSTLTDEVWRDVYKECIDIMRNAGITNTIVIDSRSYAQDYLCVAKYGQDLIDDDPLNNLMFGIHMYVEWNDRNKIIEKLNLLKSKNLPIVIGEFGYNYNNGNNNLHCEVDAQTILDECEKHGFGYMAWSWAGNNEENAWLDMTSNWVNYTEWGDFLVNGRNGIKQTSIICSVFKEASQQIINLSVNEGSLNPSFDSDVTIYSVNVAYDIESIDITATLSDSNTSLTIDGITTGSGVARTVSLGEQGTSKQVNIKVTSEDGEPEITYTITVNRAKLPVDSVTCLSGDNRYITAVEISKDGWTSADTVMLARGDDYADALAGVPLAYQMNTPILLTPTAILDGDTKAEIERLEASEVILLGGTSAISNNVSEEIEAMGITVDRIAGLNRYHTAALIAERLDQEGANFDNAFIAVGTNFADALAASSYAAIRGEPILLTGTYTLPAATINAITDLGIITTYVCGGTAAVDSDVFGELPNPTRISGANRYATALALAEEFLPDGANHVGIATGLNFPDAIAGGVWAAKNNTGILLVDGRASEPGSQVQKFLKDNDITAVTLFGGSGVVSIEMAEWFEANLGE